MQIEIKYGSWSRGCKHHAINHETVKRLCDNREPVNNWGDAGDKFEDITCRRCKKRMRKLAKIGIEFYDFYSGQKLKVR